MKTWSRVAAPKNECNVRVVESFWASGCVFVREGFFGVLFFELGVALRAEGSTEPVLYG